MHLTLQEVWPGHGEHSCNAWQSDVQPCQYTAVSAVIHHCSKRPALQRIEGRQYCNTCTIQFALLFCCGKLAGVDDHHERYLDVSRQYV